MSLYWTMTEHLHVVGPWGSMKIPSLITKRIPRTNKEFIIKELSSNMSVLPCRVTHPGEWFLSLPSLRDSAAEHSRSVMLRFSFVCFLFFSFSFFCLQIERVHNPLPVASCIIFRVFLRGGKRLKTTSSMHPSTIK